MRRPLLVAAATVLVALAAPATATARPAPAARAAQEAAASEAEVRLVNQPVAVAADGDFGVLLRVDAPEATEIAVDIYARAEAGDLIGMEPEEGAVATFPTVALPEPSPADPDAARTTGFSIALYERGEPKPDPAWGWRIDDPGVYPVRVRLRSADEETLAVLMTAIVRMPAADEEVVGTETALLVEGHAPPPDDAEARAAYDRVDPTLVRDLQPVVDALVARPDLPASFSLTPDTVTRLAGDPNATDLLRTLRGALEQDGRDLLDAPFVDIDPASLVRNDLVDELGYQRDLGRRALAALEPPVAGTWRIDAHVDEPTLDELRQRGIFRAVVAGDVLTEGGGVVGPVDAPAGDGVVRLTTASEVYSLGAASDDPVLAGHRLLARLAAAATDRADPAHIVVDIDPSVASEGSLAVVLDALALGTPLFEASTLDAVLDAPVQPASGLARAIPPDLGSYPDELRAARAELGSYASMVGQRADLLAEPERALAVSAAPTLELSERRADVDGVRLGLQDEFGAFHLPEGDTVTLGAREGEFPLPIDSDLDEPVQVVIQLEASDRLELPDDRIEATLEPGRTTVDLAVRARASGDTPVRITVRSPDDGVILAESRYVVRSTAVSGVGILLTVGAAAFLAVWWGRHLLRARRARAV